VHVTEELLQRAVQHRAAPDDRAVGVGEEADRDDLAAVPCSGMTMPSNATGALDAEHARDRVAVDVGVEHADAAPLRGERRGEVRGHRRLADAALARRDRDDLRARLGATERDLHLRVRRAALLAQPRRQRRRSSSVIEPKTSCTSSTSPSAFTAAVTSVVMRSLSGQPGIVSLIFTPTREPSIATSSTMPSSVIGLPISGSSTVASAS
jgi:hypothetical protein